jgi:hypothetical protein
MADLATLQSRLTDAEAALHMLNIGAQVAASSTATCARSTRRRRWALAQLHRRPQGADRGRRRHRRPGCAAAASRWTCREQAEHQAEGLGDDAARGHARADAQRPGLNASSLSHPDLRNWRRGRAAPDSDICPSCRHRRARATSTRNHGVAGGALQTQLDNVLGCGLWLAPTPNYVLLGKTREWASGWRDRREGLVAQLGGDQLVRRWASLTLDGLATQMFSGAWLNGDGVALPLWMPEAAGAGGDAAPGDRVRPPREPVLPARHARRCAAASRSTSTARRRPTGSGSRTPGDSYFYLFGQDMTWERIPAYTAWGRARDPRARQGARGQNRGVPALASVLQQFKVLGDYQRAELKAAVVNAHGRPGGRVGDRRGGWSSS